MSFAALMAEMDEQLRKSEALQQVEGSDDDKAKANADQEDDETDTDGDGDVVGDTDGDGDGDGNEDGDEEPLGKSFAFTLEDGTTVEAVDGTTLVKSLQAKQAEHAGVLAKALETLATISDRQNKAISEHGKLLKSLQAAVDQFARLGRGRKSTASLTVADTLAKSDQTGQAVSQELILAKCLSAQSAGALTGQDVCRARTAVNIGMPIPDDILSRLG